MSDDPTNHLSDQDRTTQPTLESLMDLVRGVKRGVDEVNSRIGGLDSHMESFDSHMESFDSRMGSFDSRMASLDSRMASLESRVEGMTRDIAAVDARVIELSAIVHKRMAELGYKIDALNRGRLQTEADHVALLQRVTDLESKVS
jgi:chromosome segregation ATPase